MENFGPPPYRKFKPLISAFIENSILKIIETTDLDLNWMKNISMFGQLQ